MNLILFKTCNPLKEPKAKKRKKRKGKSMHTHIHAVQSTHKTHILYMHVNSRDIHTYCMDNNILEMVA